MKKALKLSLSIILVLIAGSVIAQDSTAVAFVKGGIDAAEAHWPVAAKIAGILAIVSEILSIIPSQYVPANGVLDLIIKWVKALFAPKA